MSLSSVKKELLKMEKNEIIKLVSTMYTKLPDVKMYLDIYTTGNFKGLLTKYKKDIEKYVYPNNDGLLRNAVARKLIAKVERINIPELTLELELFYVHECLDIIEIFGYDDHR